MKRDHSMQVVLVDARKARLLAISDAGGTCQARELATLDFKDEGHEHRRPAMADLRSGHHTLAPGHEVEEQHQRFARQVNEWLGRQIGDKGGPAALFAPPKMLGILRSMVTARGVELYEGELIHLTPAQIAAHPKIQHALKAPVG